MDSVRALSSGLVALSASPSTCLTSPTSWLPRFSTTTSSLTASVSFPFRAVSLNRPCLSCEAFRLFARKRGSRPEEPALQPSILDELEDADEEDDLLLDDDDFGDDEFLEDDSEEYLEDEDAETVVGDGAAGGGILLAGTWWDKEALAMAEEVCDSFDGQLAIYAFRTLSNSSIQIRIENSSTKSGSPSINDIQEFSTAYRALLDKAELAKSVPDNVTLEVSSPGVDRVVRFPQDLERFKERAMYVKYASEVSEGGSSTEKDGVFRLISFDLETSSCTWGLADVRINREKAGKGRPMSKKQREWRLTIPFDSLHLVRIYPEF